MTMADEESEEDLMARALIVAKATLKRREERIKQLEQKSKDDEPYTVFGRAMTIAKEGCLLGEFAKILTQNGIKIGQNNLFRWMRDNNYLCKTGENGIYLFSDTRNKNCLSLSRTIEREKMESLYKSSLRRLQARDRCTL